MMNDVIQTLDNHRTHRQFTTQAVSDDLLGQLITSAQRMPTSQYLQAYSLIEVTDPQIRQRLAEITTMPTVNENGRLLIIVADQHRNAVLVGDDANQEALREFDRFAGSVEDATLMSAAMVLTAESLGLGSVVLGSINNDARAVIDLLHLPRLTFPVFGLQIGYPASQPERKPRLGLDALLFKDHYQEPATYASALTTFDQQLQAYYQQRSSHARDENLRHMTKAALVSAAKRHDLLKVLRSQGFLPEES